MKNYVDKLKLGEVVQFRPKGNSMVPKIHSGQLVTVSPDCGELKKGHIVMCRVNGNYYVHLIHAINGEKYQIGNNKGRINGWVSRDSIFGRVIRVED
jgi:phage repressor protein C with HTH and peptisase S24 domain